MTNQVQKYHFSLLRNLYEKTASFLGYPRVVGTCCPDDKQAYLNRIIQFIQPSAHCRMKKSQNQLKPEKANWLDLLAENLIDNYGYWQQEEQNG